MLGAPGLGPGFDLPVDDMPRQKQATPALHSYAHDLRGCSRLGLVMIAACGRA